ncbi:MAG: hypothetical protein DRJ64_03815 [Thermoprotei archaeon]|nr:MAG: hypothetical protein DRJ64_03815 [Thermoprotei archaeon]
MQKELRKKKFIKKVKKRIPWLAHTTEDTKDILELVPPSQNLKIKVPRGSLCLICRGTKLLCGKKKCPILAKYYSFMKIREMINTVDLEGSSPPDVFVGRIGYPYVYAGPLMPPFRGDTTILSRTEHWLTNDISIENIIDYRVKLVRGKFLVNVSKPEKAGRLLDVTRELALSTRYVDGEMLLKKPPSGYMLLDDNVQPMGPSAPITEIKLETTKTDPRLEKVYYDDDLLARDAILELYHNKVYVSSIQRALSVGILGLKGRRRLVPTRWSITAVDSIVSRFLRDNMVKYYETIDEYRVYETYHLDNRFIILMIPDVWSYELIEAWYPETLWNPSRHSISICGDYEYYRGRTEYASIGGCYYAARLAATEYLTKIRRQARVVVLRESYPGYILPVGVWFVRESVRDALRRPPMKFSSLTQALKYISSRVKINIETWLETSQILRDYRKQTKIVKFL